MLDDHFEDSPPSEMMAKLVRVNSDGTQTIRILKPKENTLGIYITQGKPEFKYGNDLNQFCLKKILFQVSEYQNVSLGQKSPVDHLFLKLIGAL